MNDLLKMMATGNDMGGTDRAWYEARTPDRRDAQMVAARGLLALGLTQREAAARLGVAPKTVRRWFDGSI